MFEVDKKVIRGIRNAVAARGEDWVYPDEWREEEAGSCTNLRPDGSAACIIGFIAVDQGLPTRHVSSSFADAINWGVSGAVADAMAIAQQVQDDEKSWGEAVSEFFQVLDDAGFDYSEVA